MMVADGRFANVAYCNDGGGGGSLSTSTSLGSACGAGSKVDIINMMSDVASIYTVGNVTLMDILEPIQSVLDATHSNILDYEESVHAAVSNIQAKQAADAEAARLAAEEAAKQERASDYCGGVGGYSGGGGGGGGQVMVCYTAEVR